MSPFEPCSRFQLLRTKGQELPTERDQKGRRAEGALNTAQPGSCSRSLLRVASSSLAGETWPGGEKV